MSTTQDKAIEERLAEWLPDAGDPDDLLTAAMRSAVLGAGERLHPVLSRSIMRDPGHAVPALLDLASAVEIVHAASSILDDLPCMDDAKLRCGRPAVHIEFGEDVAMLAAVALLSHAFHMVACADGISADARMRATSILAQAMGAQGLANGRHLHPAHPAPAADVALTHARTTDVLLGVASEMAAVVAHRSSLRDDGDADQASEPAAANKPVRVNA
jgi:geranylgeranyl diphosphate synthase type II